MDLMESRTAKYLVETLRSLLFLTNSLDYNREETATHAKTRTAALTKLKVYADQYQNAEFMATLSPPEKQALIQNAQAINKTIQELDQELQYLDTSKHSSHIYAALQVIDESLMVAEALLNDYIGDDGSIGYAKLANIKPERFVTTPYKAQISNLENEFDVLLNDVSQDLVEQLSDLDPIPAAFYFGLIKQFTLVKAYFKREYRRASESKEAKTKEILIPDEIKPELPSHPEEPQS